MSRRGLLFVVSAPSGAGKTTLVQQIMKQLDGVAFSVSHTTRPPRPGEVDGRDYHFVDSETFKEMINQQRFLEYAEVYGRLYGTSLDEFEKRLPAGVDVMLDIDGQGARSVHKAVDSAVLVLVLPPSYAVLEERLRNRATDSEQTILHRLSLVKNQLSDYELYRYAIINDDLEASVSALKSIVEAERHRLDSSRGHVERLLTEQSERSE